MWYFVDGRSLVRKFFGLNEIIRVVNRLRLTLTVYLVRSKVLDRF